MDVIIDTLLRHGYAILFVWVVAEQAGLPVPAVPVLLGVGALGGRGQMDAMTALAVAVAGCLPPDLAWYEAGRVRGGRVLGLLCRVSLEPDSCVRRTETLFARHGPGTLLVAKFVPGLSTVAPPLAGIVGIGRVRFLLLDGLGSVIWAGAWIGLGYVSASAIEGMASQAARLGNGLVALVAALLAGYVGVKYAERRRFLRSLRIARISPEELKRRLDAADGDLFVIDARSPIDVQAVPFAIPGACLMAAETIEAHAGEIPADREIVVYCS